VEPDESGLISELGRLRQEESEFEANLDYITSLRIACAE
jgi:hypothetical protein